MHELGQLIEVINDVIPVTTDLKVGDVFALAESTGVTRIDHGEKEHMNLPKETWVIVVDADIEATGKRMITVSKLIEHEFSIDAPVYKFEQHSQITPMRDLQPTLSFTGEPWYQYLIRLGIKPADYKGE